MVTSAAITPLRLGDGAAREWDRFVAEHPDATVYHLSAWAEVLRAAYRFQPRYLTLRGADGSLEGVMPLVYRGGPLSGPRLNSLPLVRWAGPLARREEAEAALIEAACDLVRSGPARRLHLRSGKDRFHRLVPALSRELELPTWSVELPSGHDDLDARLRAASKSLLRNVRKADAAGVRVREGRSREDLRRFYRMYLRTMRAHRELPRSLRQLVAAQRLLGPRGVFKLFVAEYEDEPVAAGIFHFFGGTADLLYNASDDRFLDVRPNHALYREVMRSAVDGGFRRFDFGAARPGSSLAEFKRRWSAEPVSRYRYTFPRSSGEDAAAEHGAPLRRNALLNRAWGRVPVPLTRLGGAVAYRYL
jgi:hypothetical protein